MPQSKSEAGAATLVQDGDAFQVRLASSGATYVVPSDKSIVEALRENGIDVDTSCEEGLCGTCKTRYLDGTPEHNDFVLSREEQEEWVQICCARSKTPLLVLDL